LLRSQTVREAAAAERRNYIETATGFKKIFSLHMHGHNCNPTTAALVVSTINIVCAATRSQQKTFGQTNSELGCSPDV
jgi:hypothetical protein